MVDIKSKGFLVDPSESVLSLISISMPPSLYRPCSRSILPANLMAVPCCGFTSPKRVVLFSIRIFEIIEIFSQRSILHWIGSRVRADR